MKGAKQRRLAVPYYNLAIGENVLSSPARDPAAALQIFGRDIGKTLTLVDQGVVAEYLLDEWTVGPHWVRPHIPVWVIPPQAREASCRRH
jgi:hypothetical protein